MTKKSFKKLSVVIPCYNEKNSISEIINQVKNVVIPLEKEIIIVDDFSTDGTREIIKNIQKNDERVKIFFNEKNMGKGYSLRNGFAHTTGDLIIVQHGYQDEKQIVKIKYNNNIYIFIRNN